jgi:hypothetical protein
LVQFTAPHAYLSTATGLAFSARAIGGAFGTAVLDGIINGWLARHYASSITDTATAAGLPASSVAGVLEGLQAGNSTAIMTAPGMNDIILEKVMQTSYEVYANAYHRAWGSIIPFTVVALVAIWFLKDVSELMTDKVEMTVEKVRNEKTEA